MRTTTMQGTGAAAAVWLRRARLRHWRPGPVDVAATLVGAGIVGALVMSAVRSAAATGGTPSASLSTRTGVIVAGALVVAALLASVTSGVRGGPLALGSATVVLVLLAPVDRAMVLRSAACRQVVVAAVAGASVAAAGWVVLAHHVARPRGRLEAWVVAGLALGVACAGLSLLLAGLRVTGRGGLVIRALVVGWWLVEVIADTVASPMAAAVALLFTGRPSPAGAAYAVGTAAALAAVGVVRIGGLSVERAWRRSGVADQLRVALGLNDLRTAVLLLRRRAEELPRSRPWHTLTGPWSRRHPVVARSARALFRWPLSRLVRFAGTAVAAGAVAAVTPDAPALGLVVACLAYAAALDASDALAQELDHPDLARGYPVAGEWLAVRHVPVPLALMTVFTVLGAGVVGAVHGVAALTVALVAAPVVALAATAGAALTASRTARPLLSVADFGRPPEVVLPRVALQLVAPVIPLVATVVPAAGATGAADAVVRTAAGATLAIGMLLFAVLRRRLVALVSRLAVLR